MNSPRVANFILARSAGSGGSRMDAMNSPRVSNFILREAQDLAVSALTP
jgi:hypothetical protein